MRKNYIIPFINLMQFVLTKQNASSIKMDARDEKHKYNKYQYCLNNGDTTNCKSFRKEGTIKPLQRILVIGQIDRAPKFCTL